MTDNEIKILIEAETDKANKDIARLNKELSKLQKEVIKTGKTSKSIDQVSRSFKQLAIHVGKLMAIYGSAKGVISAVNMLKDMENQLADVAKTTGLTGLELELFNKTLQDLSKKLQGIKYSELLDIAAAAGQLGVSGTDDLTTFTEAVAKIAVATEYTSAEAAVAFGKLGNAIGLPVSEIENLASSVNELSASTAATVSEITNVAQRMAGTASLFGLTAGEITGLAATMKSLGITTEVSGSAMQKILMEMQNRVGAFADFSGMKMEEFAALMEDKPVEALKLFFKAANQLSSSDLTQSLDALGLSGIQVAATVTKLSQNYGLMVQKMEEGTVAFKENLSIQEEYEIKAKTFQSSLMSMKSSVEVFVYTLGGPLLNALKQSTDDITKMIESMGEDDVRAFAEAIGATAKALGEMLVILIKAVAAVSRFSSEYSDLVGTLILVAGAFKAATIATAAFGARFATLATVELAATATSLANVGAALKALIPMLVANAPIIAFTASIAALTYAFENYIGRLEETISVHDRITKANNNLTDAYNELAKIRIQDNKYIFDSVDAKNAMISKINDYIISLTEEADKIKHAAGQTKESVKQRMELEQRIKSLTNVMYDLVNANVDEAKSAAELAKSHETEKKALDKLNAGYDKRIAKANTTLAALLKAERKYAKDISALRQEIIDIDRDYYNKRQKLADDHDSIIFEARNKGVNDYQKYMNSMKRVDELYAKGRQEMAKNNMEASQKYFDEALSLAEQFAGEEIKVNDKVMVTRSQSMNDYMSNYKAIHEEQLTILYQQEKAEKEASLLKLQMAKAEMAATKGQIVLQKALIAAIQSQKTENFVGLNADAVTKALKEIDTVIDEINSQEKKIKVSLEVDKKNYEQSLMDINTKTKQWKKDVELNEKPKITVQLREDIEPAVKNHEYWLRWVQKQKAETQLWLETHNAQKQEKEFRDTVEKTPAELPVDADTSHAVESAKEFQDGVDKAPPAYQTVWADMNEAYLAVSEFQKYTNTTHDSTLKIYSDTSPARSEVISFINWVQAQRPVLTVTQRVVQSRATGGPIFGGSGKVPGYDSSDSDKVLARLTGGEHVISRAAADAIGHDILEYMNRYKKLPGYATGGMVSSVGASPVATQPITLNIGGQSFNVMADRAVADSIQRFIETEGGL